MHRVKRFMLVPMVLLLAAAVLLFVLENQQVVGLDFFGFSSPALPVSALLIIALLVGMLLGPGVRFLLGWGRDRSKKPVKLGGSN